jgi:hypothetical protein
MRKYRRIFSALAAIVLPVAAASSALAQQIITVDTTSDGSVFECPPNRPCLPPCRLRDAITAANSNRPVFGCAAGQSSGIDKIVFNVGSGMPTIKLLSELPPILEPVEINGGTGGATRIEITPGNINNPPGRRIDGLILATGESTIRNLVINGFSGSGIVMTSITVPGNGIFTNTIPRTTGFITATSTPLKMWGSKATSEFSACKGL